MPRYHIRCAGEDLPPCTYDQLRQKWLDGELPSESLVRENGFEKWVPVEVALLPISKAKSSASPGRKGWVASGSTYRPMLYPAIALAILGIYLGVTAAWWLSLVLIFIGILIDYTCHACSGCGEWMPGFKRECPHCGAKFIKPRHTRSPQ